MRGISHDGVAIPGSSESTCRDSFPSWVLRQRRKSTDGVEIEMLQPGLAHETYG